MKKIEPQVVKLINAQAYAVTTNVDITDEFKKAEWVSTPVFWLVAVENSGSATCDVDLQVSQDNGTTYVEFLSFTQLSASGNELLNPTKYPWGQKVRAVVTLSTTGNWTITLYASGPAQGAGGE